MEKIIHQIWVGPYAIPSRERKFIEEIKSKHTNYQHILWTNDNLPPLPEHIKSLMDTMARMTDYAFQADVLRIFLVARYGGIYLDADMECIGNGLNDVLLENYDGLICQHGGDDYTIPNGVFGAAKDSRLITHLLYEIKAESAWYGPSWMGDTVKKMYNMVRETPHEQLNDKLKADNVMCMTWQHFNANYFRHHGLASWAPENKKLFEQGLIE